MCTYICATLDAFAEKAEAVGAVVAGGTFVECCEVDGVFKGAVFNETAFGNVLIIFRQAHDKAQADLGVGV